MHRKIATILFALVLFSVVLFAGWSFLSSAFVAHADHSWSQDQGPASDSPSAQIYKERCAVCHDKPTGRIPPRSQIEKQTTADVVQTLTTGTMKQWAEGLTAEQIKALATHLTAKQSNPLVLSKPSENLCKDPAEPINLNGSGWNGWGRDLDNSRFQPQPGIKPEDVPRLKVKWAWTHPGPMATGQPTIIGDRLFVTTEMGQLFSLNAQTGCTYWAINAGAGLRSSPSVGPLPPGSKAKFAVYFGDQKSNVQAVDATTGELLWKTKVEEHRLSRITGAPVLYRDRLYVPVSSIEEVTGTDTKYECCKFRGSLVALDAYSGKLLWKSFTVQEEPKPFKINSAGTQMYGPAGGAIWSAPTLDLKRKLIYAVTGNSYTDVPTGHSDAVVAFELGTGKIHWVNQVTPKDNFLVGCRQPGAGNCPEDAGPDYDFGSSPILHTLPGGKQVILAGQKSGVIYALDPDHKGKILWQVRLGIGGALGGIEWGFAADVQNVYVPVADVFGAGRKPGLTALHITTGKTLWQVPAPAANCSWGKVRCNNSQSAAATLIPGVAFFRHYRRPPARLPDQGRYDHLGLRHGRADRNRECWSNERRRSGRRRADNRRWRPLYKLGLRSHRRTTWESAAGFHGRRQVTLGRTLLMKCELTQMSRRTVICDQYHGRDCVEAPGAAVPPDARWRLRPTEVRTPNQFRGYARPLGHSPEILRTFSEGHSPSANRAA